MHHTPRISTISAVMASSSFPTQSGEELPLAHSGRNSWGPVALHAPMTLSQNAEHTWPDQPLLNFPLPASLLRPRPLYRIWSPPWSGVKPLECGTLTPGS